MTFRMFAERQNRTHQRYSDTLYDTLHKGSFNIRSGFPDSNKIPASHTYLGQFISHELISSSDGVGRVANGTLELSSIYGDPLQLELFSDTGHFLLGKDSANLANDLPRCKTGKAIIPEPRNDENILVSQMHLFWLKMHNKLVDELELGGNKETIVQSAREHLIYIFQRVITDDYLKYLLTSDIHNLYFIQHEQFFLKGRNDPGVPTEFTNAAFRMGHSMVRLEYEIQKNENNHTVRKELLELFRRDFTNKLPKDLVVDWSIMLSQKSSAIDAKIAPAMGTIPDTNCPSLCGIHTNIVKANLNRGLDANLPYPEDVIEEIRAKPNNEAFKLKLDTANYEIINGFGKVEGVTQNSFPDKKWPMWLYIIAEAGFHKRGESLGTFGSLVVAEVFSYILKQQHSSDRVKTNVESLLNNNQLLTFAKLVAWLN